MNVTEARAKASAKLREIRTVTVPRIELRTEGTDDAPGMWTFTGCASTTDTPYEVNDWFGSYTEVIRSGAFTKTLGEQADVRLLVNHDGVPLARTKSGTLSLSEGEEGLMCEASLDPDSPLAQQVRSAMVRGDMDQMSFAFRVTRQEWSPDYMQRDIIEVELHDVSVVTYPANPTTSANLRSAAASVVGALIPQARARALQVELREGKALSADTLAVLQQVLDLVAAADDAVDEAQPLLADLMGVPNPDDPDEDNSAADGTDDGSDGPEEDSERSMDLRTFEARARALAVL